MQMTESDYAAALAAGDDLVAFGEGRVMVNSDGAHYVPPHGVKVKRKDDIIYTRGYGESPIRVPRENMNELLDHMAHIQREGQIAEAARLNVNRDIAERLGFSIKRIFARRYLASAAYVA